jgi:hypothetical protein
MNQAHTEAEKLDRLVKGFDKIMAQIIQTAQRELELALALSDDEAQAKARVKRDAWQSVKRMFDEAITEASLDEVAARYGRLVEAARREAREGLERAADEEAFIEAQIRLNILGAPVHGIFTSRFRDAAGSLPPGSHWQEVPSGR